MTINERIVYYRKRVGLTQEQVAERMEMKTGTYRKMESQGKIDSDRLVLLADIFGIEVKNLLYDNSNTLEQPKPVIKQEIFEPTAREKAAIMLIRSLPKDIRNEVYDYIKNISDNNK